MTESVQLFFLTDGTKVIAEYRGKSKRTIHIGPAAVFSESIGGGLGPMQVAQAVTVGPSGLYWFTKEPEPAALNTRHVVRAIECNEASAKAWLAVIDPADAETKAA